MREYKLSPLGQGRLRQFLPWIGFLAILLALLMFTGVKRFPEQLFGMSAPRQSPIDKEFNLIILKSQGDVNRLNDIHFKDHAEYMDMSHDSDFRWTELLPSNGGFVRTTDRNGRKEDLGISMFHQLHCLSMLRDKIQKLQEPARPIYANSHHGARSGSHEDPAHWQHCFDYLRQTILCSANGNIEAVRVNHDHTKTVDGAGMHTCRNSKALYALSTESFIEPIFIHE